MTKGSPIVPLVSHYAAFNAGEQFLKIEKVIPDLVLTDATQLHEAAPRGQAAPGETVTVPVKVRRHQPRTESDHRIADGIDVQYCTKCGLTVSQMDSPVCDGTSHYSTPLPEPEDDDDGGDWLIQAARRGGEEHVMKNGFGMAPLCEEGKTYDAEGNEVAPVARDQEVPKFLPPEHLRHVEQHWITYRGYTSCWAWSGEWWNMPGSEMIEWPQDLMEAVYVAPAYAPSDEEAERLRAPK